MYALGILILFFGIFIDVRFCFYALLRLGCVSFFCGAGVFLFFRRARISACISFRFLFSYMLIQMVLYFSDLIRSKQAFESICFERSNDYIEIKPRLIFLDGLFEHMISQIVSDCAL